jgi:hypothetical protein
MSVCGCGGPVGNKIAISYYRKMLMATILKVNKKTTTVKLEDGKIIKRVNHKTVWI